MSILNNMFFYFEQIPQLMWSKFVFPMVISELFFSFPGFFLGEEKKRRDFSRSPLERWNSHDCSAHLTEAFWKF